jgi:hypothetical protein
MRPVCSKAPPAFTRTDAKTPVIAAAGFRIRVNLMSAFEPHRHGPVIRNGVQLVIDVPTHTPEKSDCTEELDEICGFKLVVAAKLQATGANERNKSSRTTPWTQKLMGPLLCRSIWQRMAYSTFTSSHIKRFYW